MKRAPGLVAISRRQFCAFGAALGAGVALASCTDGGAPAIQTGPLDGNGPDGPKPPIDAAVHPGDGPGPMGDAAMPSCTATTIDVGAPSTFALNTPVYHSSGNFFIVRDSGGLYALTARCTHQGVTCNSVSNQFRCPAHGAVFSINGSPVSGPIVTGLKHYGMCLLGNGHVAVETTITVAQSARLIA